MPIVTKALVIRDKRLTLPKHPTLVYSQRTVPWSVAVIHHSLTTSGTSESFARFHIEENGWPGIAYHYVVTKEGIIDWCWDLGTKSYHVGKHNNYCVGVCLVGDFRTQKPTDVQLEATFGLLKNVLMAQTVKGHSELKGYEWKQCPVLNMDIFRGQLAAWKP